MKFNVFYWAVISYFLVGCTKEKNPPNDDVDHGGVSPWRTIEIFIEEPLENSVIEYGDKVFVHGEIIGNFLMHGYSIRIYNGTIADERVFFKNRHTHGETINFEGEWINDIEEPGILTVEILAVGNHEGTLDMYERVEINNLGKDN